MDKRHLELLQNIEDIRCYNHTMKGETEFQRFKTEKDGQEEKQDRSSNSSYGTDGKSRGKSSNRNKATDNSLVQTEKQKKVVIEFKAREIKHGRSTCTPDVVTTSKESYNKSHLDGTEGKRLYSFAVQRSKALKKKTEKAELCKLKLKGKQTMLEKIRSSVHDSHVPHKKADGKKLSEDVRNSKRHSGTSTQTVYDNRSFTKRSKILSNTWEEEYEDKCKEFSKKKQHLSKHTPSCYSTERLQRWDSCKQKKQDANSDKAAGNTKKEKRDFEATSLCFKQRTDKCSTSIPTCFSNFEVPCTSDTYQEGEDTKPVQKSAEVFPPLQDSQIPETDQEMQIVEDLHVARVQKRMMLPVVETCGELTSMEIDHPEQDLNISAETSTYGLNILVVIDTNIMISHLEFVRSLKCENIPGVGRLALIIPWVVLQELDNLKKGKMLQHVRDKAIPAVQFIYMCLKNQDSKLWGQSMQLASQKIYGLSDENNDDRVLQCCLQYQNLFPQAVVILCTEDKNLCSKAIVSDVKAFCKADLVTVLQNLNVNMQQNCFQLQQPKCDTEIKKTGRGDASLTTECPDILPDLEKNLGEALSCILETEMKIAFGNLWMEILYLKPPWTLENLLKCYRKHWMAVFGHIVPRSLLSTVECLYRHLCTGKPVDPSTVCILLQESKKLLHAFSSRSDYNGVLPQAYAEVNKLYQTLTEVRSNREQNLSEDMVLSENAVCEKMEAMAPNLQSSEEKKLNPSFHVSQESRHQEIWSVLEGVWNTINLYSIEIFQKLGPGMVTVTAKSSFEEALLGLQKLMSAVNDIREGISRILTPTSSFQDIWALYDFLISNEVNNSMKFTAEELFECVSQEMYRKKLEIGCCQLVQLEHTIKQCHASVQTEAKNRGWL
ncbi:transcriptional protein SWT1 isoform X2 [Melopsittacus undulatus]|uniref:Transcriptional protein SWT1 n=1 Tax=Melopsittacus undulatus TaxID=13146 RepID=A0A8C6JMB3_MELUD|nr:transcriptional protein SWT1 isoform X2 [Melopsittacus undulatus]